jgi:GH24 family phage-related lysozyme (muramidase)
MDISQAGVSFTAQFEGLAQVNQNDGLVYPYADPVGLPTIGYGSRTDINGNPVTMNTAPITQDQALQLLNTVLEQFVAAVNNMFNSHKTNLMHW